MNINFNPKKQKGINHVKQKAERIVVNNTWSIEVPAGYSYCVDPSYAGKDLEGEPYCLQIQKSTDCDFSQGYGSEISITVRYNFIAFNYYCCDATELADTFKQIVDQLSFGSGDVIRAEKDILIGFKEAGLFSSFNFYVLVGGTNRIYTGQITFGDDVSGDTEKIAKKFVNSIEPVTLSNLASTDKLARLDKSYLPDFDTADYISVDGAFKVPVPAGFEGKTYRDGNWKATVVPKGFNASGEISDAKMSLAIQNSVFDFSGRGLKPMEMINTAIKILHGQSTIEWFQGEILTEKNSKRGIVLNAFVTNNACDKNLNPVLICAGEKVYFGYVTAHYSEAISDYEDTKWDIKSITAAWLSHILFKGEKASTKASKSNKTDDNVFKIAFPDKSLYPHYDHKMNNVPNLPGTIVIVNPGGTDYAFYSLKDAADPDNDNFSEAKKDLFSRIVEQDKGDYDLDQEARKMSSVFHVDESVFDMKNDREVELVNGYMKSAYMLSALRSFGWTLSDYCSKKKVLPENVSPGELKSIIDFIAKRNWLNYDSTTYFNGLCSGSDLHVYYVPDNISQDDRSELLPTQEDYDRVSKMQSIAPSYNEILSDVQSLDALRGSLKFIYPAVKTLYDELVKKRNYMKPLEGNEADIVYAWCALAIAAKEPFFTEDGPMNYYLSQPKHNDMPAKAGTSDGNTGKDEVSKRKPSSKGGTWSFQTADTSKINTKLLKSDKGIAVRILSIAEVNKEENLPELEQDFREYMTAFNPDFHGNMETILPLAEKYSALFIDENGDNLLEEGKLVNTAPIHSLRSFVWTATNLSKKKASNIFPLDAPEEMWIELARFIQSKGFVNYKQCDQDAKVYGRSLFRAKEVGLKYHCHDYFQYEEALIKSIKSAARDDLSELVSILREIIPVMELYYKQITDSTNSETEDVDAMRCILQGWTAFAYACRTPFCVVQKSSYKGNSDGKNKPVWTEKCETKEYEGGKFTAIGTSLIAVNDDNEVLRIPEGITDIYLNKVYYHEWNPEYARKVVYPESFTGTVVIPLNTEEVEILGDFDDLALQAYKPFAPLPKLKRIVCKGTARSMEYCDLVIGEAENLEEIVFPEGLRKIEVRELCYNNIKKVYLPESLEIIEEDNVNYPSGILGDYPLTTFVVYRTCPVLDLLKRQLKAEENEIREWNDTFKNSPDSQKHHSYKVKEVDAPWISSALTFSNQISKLYEKSSAEGIEVEMYRIVRSAFKSGRDFRLSKDCIIKEAKKAGLSNFAEIINNTNDVDNLTVVLADDIKRTIETRIQKEKEKKREEEERRKAEIIKLSQSMNISDLEKAVKLLKTNYSENTESEQLSKRCTEKINSIKSDKYAHAIVLAEEDNESSVVAALSMLRDISPFEDSESRIAMYHKKLENMKAYSKAVSMMSGDDISCLTEVKKVFEGLGDYKDSVIKAAACEKYLSELCEEKYLEAQSAEAVYSVESQTLAITMYSELGDYKDAAEKIAKCTINITQIQEILDLEEQLGKHKEDLKSLTGFFKRRQRQEKEELISKLENQLAELRSQLTEVN